MTGFRHHHFFLPLLFHVLLVVVEVNCAPPNSSPIVTTKYGKVRGSLVQAQIQQQVIDVYQFTSVPYATAPVGLRRFRRTAPLKSWNDTGVLDATRISPGCPRSRGGISVTGEEDCLFLNIWVPKNAIPPVNNNKKQTKRDTTTASPLSVFVFIHGASFPPGPVKYPSYNGTFLAGFTNIIVVTIQYRLGSLGFSYLGNDQVPGNMGLWDQREALRWIFENIASFGGNKNAITIGGESDGAASVTAHLLSPYTRQYFQRAILQSGSVISPRNFHTTEEALRVTNIIFQEICANLTTPWNASSLSVKLECLKSADFGDFSFLDNIPGSLIYGNTWGPVIDGDFLPRDPMKMLMAGDVYKVPLLVGANKDEGSMFADATPTAARFLPGFRNSDKSFDLVTFAIYQRLMGERFRFLSDGNPFILQDIQLHYWPRNHEGFPKGAEIYKAFYDADGDYGILCPTYYFANTIASSGAGNNNKVFAYYFTHRRTHHWAPSFMGVLHGDELPFMFGELFAPPSSDKNLQSPTKQELQFSQIMMAYWGNFIKTGDPNGAESFQQLRLWPPLISKSAICPEQFFELSVATLVNKHNETDPIICGLKKRECMLWQDYMPSLTNRLTSCYPTTTPICPNDRNRNRPLDDGQGDTTMASRTRGRNSGDQAATRFVGSAFHLNLLAANIFALLITSE